MRDWKQLLKGPSMNKTFSINCNGSLLPLNYAIYYSTNTII